MTPITPRPAWVSAIAIATGLAVAQWIVQTSGTWLIWLSTFTGKREAFAQEDHEDVSGANGQRTAGREFDEVVVVPGRRTGRGPDASLNAKSR